MTRKLSTVLFLVCFFAAVSASAKVCFLPNVFGGDNDCLIGIRSVGDDPNDNGGVEPDPNNPCGPNAVSSFLTGEHTGLFAYFETAYGAGCWIVGCSGLYGSTSSPQSLNISVFTVSSATYGGVTCHYATGCREPYKKECSDGAPIATYNLDSLTCYQCDEQADCPTANSCAGYTVKSAPANGSLDGAPCQVVTSDCTNGDLLYKFKCDDGYEPQGSRCVAKECQGAYATEASKCASTGTCNGTWSIGLSTNGRSGDKYCYNCVCTGAQTCDVVTCGAEVSVPNNATCSNWCTPQDASCNPTGAERCTEWTCNTGYKKSGSGCVQKTCGDYSPYIYDSCTNKECDSQTCSSAPQAVGSGTNTCFTAPSGSCTVSCDTNPCNGYDTYTKPANSHWTSEACRYKYVSGTSCIDGGDWYKDWACNDGYTKSLDGKSCVMNASTPEEPTNTCTPEPSDSTPTYPKCYIKDTSADDGCGGTRTTYTYKCTENQTCTSTGCVDKCTPRTCTAAEKPGNNATCSEECIPQNSSCVDQPSQKVCTSWSCTPYGTQVYNKKQCLTVSTDNGCGGTYYTSSCTGTQSCDGNGNCAEPEKCETKYADGTTTQPGSGYNYSTTTVNGSPCYYGISAKECANGGTTSSSKTAHVCTPNGSYSGDNPCYDCVCDTANNYFGACPGSGIITCTTSNGCYKPTGCASGYSPSSIGAPYTSTLKASGGDVKCYEIGCFNAAGYYKQSEIPANYTCSSSTTHSSGTKCYYNCSQTPVCTYQYTRTNDPVKDGSDSCVRNGVTYYKEICSGSTSRTPCNGSSTKYYADVCHTYNGVAYYSNCTDMPTITASSQYRYTLATGTCSSLYSASNGIKILRTSSTTSTPVLTGGLYYPFNGGGNTGHVESESIGSLLPGDYYLYVDGPSQSISGNTTSESCSCMLRSISINGQCYTNESSLYSGCSGATSSLPDLSKNPIKFTVTPSSSNTIYIYGTCGRGGG